MQLNDDLLELINIGLNQIQQEKAEVERQYNEQKRELEAESKRINNEWLRVALEHVPAVLHDFISFPTDDPIERDQHFIDVVFSFDGLVPFLARIKKNSKDHWYLDAYYLAGTIHASAPRREVSFSFDQSRCSPFRMGAKSKTLAYVMANAKEMYNYIASERRLIIVPGSKRINITT